MKRSLLAAFLVGVVLAGCGEDETALAPVPAPQAVSAASVIAPAPGGVANPDGGVAATLTVSGKISFDRLIATGFGLDALPQRQNAAFVRVEVVRHDDPSTLIVPAVATDALGDYSVTFATDRDFYVRARAQFSVATLDVRVLHTQMAAPVTHAVSSPIRNRALGSQTVNVNADLTLPTLRAGAFAALDTVRKLALATQFTGSPTLGALDLYWAPGNIGTSFMRDLAMLPVNLVATGFTNTGALGPPGIVISGARWDSVGTGDHDEFDEAVIAHEFVHFLMRTQSRDNNWGGDHNGEALVHGAAYAEGLPTGLGCLLLANKNYIDTVGLPPWTTTTRFTFDCENPGFVAGVPSAGTGVSGYSAEFVVAGVVWDLLDGAAGNPGSTDGDPTAIARDGFLQSFYALRTRSGAYDLAYLASLLQQLVDDARTTTPNANTLLAPFNASFPPAIADQWPPNMALPGTDSASLNAALGPGGTPANRQTGLSSNAVYRLELTMARSVTINLNVTSAGYNSATHQVDLFLYDIGNNQLAAATGSMQGKSMTINLGIGVYLLRLHHAASNPAPVNYSLVIP